MHTVLSGQFLPLKKKSFNWCSKEQKENSTLKRTEKLPKFSYNDSFLTAKNPFAKQDRPLLLDEVTASFTSFISLELLPWAACRLQLAVQSKALAEP